MFETIAAAPADPILGLTDAYKNDPRSSKVNLGVGVFQDETGVTPVLESVQEAERRMLARGLSKSYFPISGSPAYSRVVQDMLFGAGHEAQGRARTAHTPGGTGGLRVGGDFIHQFFPKAKVWVSKPTWANHRSIFEAAGVETAEYAYYSPATKGLDFDAMAEALRKVPAGDFVLLHACCHNPTGVDLTPDQWRSVADIAAKAGWVPFLDFAYQGFGDGVEQDRVGLLALAEAGLEILAASSFSKNFGLYCERTGAFSLVARSSQAADAAFSQVKRVIRANYSNPPAHGGLIVTTILEDAELAKKWRAELDGMRERIASIRASFVQALADRGVPGDFSFISRQKGMFSFSGLTDDQVAWLLAERAIYIVKGGRINVAGITPQNLGYLCDSIGEAIKAKP